jgi:DNA repair photolyase
MRLQNKKQVFGTLEWASFNENFISGCAHDCRYCYSKEMAIRFKRKKPSSWHKEKVNLLKIDTIKKKYSGRIMFPSSHDITPQNTLIAVKYLRSLLAAGNEILLVTKPHLLAIKRICSEFQNFRQNLKFRFTISSTNSNILKFWEPNAPSFEERLEALHIAFNNDFSTSISIEPMLDTIDTTIELVETLLPYVTDSIWLGKPNFLLRRLKMNGETSEEVIKHARKLEKMYTNDEINRLYMEFKSNDKIKWKESIKKVLGLKIAQQAGLDE